MSGSLVFTSLWQRAFGDPPATAVAVGKRLYLRRPRVADFEEWAALRAQSRGFLTPWEPTWPRDALSEDSFRRRVRRASQEWRDEAGYGLFLVRLNDEALLGGITIGSVRRGVAQAATLGYWLGAPHARQGYMTEAVHCALGFGFERLGLHRIEAACLPNNVASRGLLLKCGFREEGVAREYLKIAGRWTDHLLFGILATDSRPRG